MRALSVRLRSMCFLALSEMPMRACTFSCRLHTHLQPRLRAL